MNGNIFVETLELSVSSNASLTALQNLINVDVKRKVIGVAISDDATGKSPSGKDKVGSTITHSAYLTINNYSENAVKELPVSVISAVTKERGYYPLNVGTVDFNKSFVKFGDTTDTNNKVFIITFFYEN